MGGSSFEYPHQLSALSRAKSKGFLDAIPALADAAAAALGQVDHKRLLDRLTMLGMSMANGKSADEQKAWLHETTRLLADLPEAILFDAIDTCVMEPGRVFLPSIGEIRDKAAEPLRRAEREAAHLRRLALLIREGVTIPDWVQPSTLRLDPEPEKKIVTPEERRAILAEYGLGENGSLASLLNPERPKTRAEWIAEGKEPPPIKTDPESDGRQIMA